MLAASILFTSASFVAYPVTIGIFESITIQAMWGFCVFFLISCLARIDLMHIPMKFSILSRTLFGYIALIGLEISRKFTSESNITIFYCTLPILVAVVSRLSLCESLSYYDWLLTFAAYFGVVIAQNPFYSRDSYYNLDYLGMCWAGVASIFGAIAFVLQKKLSQAQVNFVQPCFYFSLYAWIVSPSLSLVEGNALLGFN